MNKKKVVRLGVLFLQVAIGPAFGTADKIASGKGYIENRVVVKMRVPPGRVPGCPLSTGEIGGAGENLKSTDMLMHKYNREFLDIRLHNPTGYHIVETRGIDDIEALCCRLRREPFVEDASPDYIITITGTPPNDTYFPYQYALHNTGQVYYPAVGTAGTPGSDIKALAGWDWGGGGDGVIIAVIDTGVAFEHEDLVNKIVPGYNVVDKDMAPRDDNGHGTFVASIAAAEADNGVGIAGVARNAMIMPIKVVGADGKGSCLHTAEGIYYAVDRGVQVLNISLGTKKPSFILERACQYAYEKGAVIVAAAGNYWSDVFYPAAYDAYCIAVGATDADDKWIYLSNPGPSVDVAAPGKDVVGADFSPYDPGSLNSYMWRTGTSYAAPYVSGAAALLIGSKPFLSNARVITLIKITADDVNASEYPGVDKFVGYGRINLETLLGPYYLCAEQETGGNADAAQ
jgi:thermitase